ncbi:MAG: DUF1015 family protein [Deltaproteobacteria bacterium]|nr:DUF1015 family protein [Deltaproteobacteria bacterium]NIS77563.1 DUF1015 family protein [Deltaproteobacteria bacterium]
MAKVRPIRGLRYGEQIEDKGLVVAPPYDVISKEDQIKLHARHPNNIVWIDYGLDGVGERDEKYRRANEMLEASVAEQVLVRDEKPAFYYYEQEFELEGMGRLVRTGFICGMLLEKFGEGSVFPHERTLLTPKLDRLNLMKHTATATSPIFAIYDDDENHAASLFLQAIQASAPDVSVLDDVGVCHRMWVVTDEKVIGEVESLLSGRRVFIADGHHRYETALEYRNWMRERAHADPSSAWNYVLVFLSATGDGGLVILPTHRGVYGLDRDKIETLTRQADVPFKLLNLSGGVDEMVEKVSSATPEERIFGMVDKTGNCSLLKIDDINDLDAGWFPSLPPAVRNLDVSLLHGLILERVLGISPQEISSGEKVRFYKDLKRGLSDLKGGVIQLLFYLNPIRMEQFIEVSESGVILPQKSTYFYPKILTGLVMSPVSENDRVG